MGRKLNMILLFVIALFGAFALHGSTAQRTHVVGGPLTWVVPPGGSISYTSWASTQTFTVGDVLVFNFTAGSHDVAEVSNSENYDACNISSPISISTESPTNITLRTAGPHFYICTFGRHCELGQKLAINVSTATPPPPAATPQLNAPSPSPAASVPTPSPLAGPTPAPSPSRTYLVGDALGWVVPPAGEIPYQTWATDKTFMVGDILVFNFTNGRHDVAEMASRTAYDSCNTNSTSTPIMTSPARITLTTSGEHFFVCTFARHCPLGQKLAINVTGTGATPPSSTPATSPSSGGSPGPAFGPSSTSTPPSTPGVSAPPPPNSAPSFAGAALSAALLSIALAFFLY